MLGHLDLGKKRKTTSVAVSQLGELATQPHVRDALAFFARERKWIDDIHLQACKIPAPTFLETQRAEWMAEQLRGFGWEAHIDRAGNVIALAGPDRGQALVAVTAHLDTVLAPRNPDEVFLERDGRFRGPGTSDNGVGLAAVLALAKALRPSPSRALQHLALIANVGEEGEGNLSGMRHLCGKSSLSARIRHYVVLDGPHTDHITAEALACRRFEVVFQGPGGHSWSDFGVPNPVNALSRVIAGFADARNDAGTSPRTSFNFGVFEGGSSVNAIPSEARAKLDLRSESPAVMDSMASLLNELVVQAAQVENDRSVNGRLSVRVKENGSRPGGKLPADSELLNLVRSTDSLLGIRSHPDCASTDANIPLSMGLSAISLGAGGHGGGAHTPGEWYHPEGRDLGLRRILLVVWALLEQLAAAAE